MYTVVPEQELPDGNFPTVSYPNLRLRKPLPWVLSWPRRRTRIWSWRRTRMRIVWVYM